MNHLTRLVSVMSVVLALTFGVAAQATAGVQVPSPTTHQQVVSSQPATARVSGGCRDGACTAYLNQSETIALSKGRIPAPPAIVTGILRVAYYALAVGHVLIAKGYVARRTCVAFTLNIRPWASQGMIGWRCPWS